MMDNLTVESIRKNVEQAVVGSKEVTDLAVICLLCGGHMLIDDVPGTGKTLFAKTFARSLDCKFGRIQFTPDLLPSEILGVNIFNMKNAEFSFSAGPVFTNILLADEINRATPKTQAGLLECMEERQVTVDGNTYQLEKPFMVIATQNPLEIAGTFPLPEPQLDRFLVKASLGYPTREESNRIITENAVASNVVSAAITKADIEKASKLMSKVFLHPDIVNYISTIIEVTRRHEDVLLGASPRAGVHLARVAKGFAFIESRDYVLPDDIKKAAIPVLAHRLVLAGTPDLKERKAEKIIDEITKAVPVPTEAVFDGRS